MPFWNYAKRVESRFSKTAVAASTVSAISTMMQATTSISKAVGNKVLAALQWTAGGWLGRRVIENTHLWGKLALRMLLFSPKRGASIASNYLRILLGQIFAFDTSIPIQKWMNDNLRPSLKSRPWSDGETAKARQTSKAAPGSVKDWLKCHLPLQLLGTAALQWLVYGGRVPSLAVVKLPGVITKLSLMVKKIPVLSDMIHFNSKLLVFRVVFETVFYWLHRAMHTKWLYDAIHKYHHTIKKADEKTSLKFELLDLLLEFFVPAVAGVLFLAIMGVEMPTWLILALLQHGLEYELSAHSPKLSGLVSAFPMLGPIFGESTIVHQVHHEHNSDASPETAKNFGLDGGAIVNWDRLCGTRSRKVTQKCLERQQALVEVLPAPLRLLHRNGKRRQEKDVKDRRKKKTSTTSASVRAARTGPRIRRVSTL